MRTTPRVRRTLVASLAVFAAATASAAGAPSGVETIIQLTPGADASAGRAAIARHGGTVTGEVPIIRGLVARVPAAQLAALRREGVIKAVSRNGRVKDTGTVDTRNLQTAYPYAVAAPSVWNNASGSATGRGVGVAVIDTGIAGNLPDFRRSWSDTSSRVVGSAVVNPLAQSAGDSYGHGTHVAGIIAGNGNLRYDDDNGHFIGVAPKANLVSVKVSDETGAATVLDVIYGLQFVVDHKSDYNIRVVNMSLTSTVSESATTDPLDAAVEEAWNRGVVVVAAAGNRGGSGDAVSYAPANDPFVITVGASDDNGTQGTADDTVASWSSTGTTQDGVAKPDVVAPGAHMVSTLAPGSAFADMCPSCVVDGSYIRAGGTSMSAPVVSGLVALMLERRPWMSPNQVKGTLMGTAVALPGGDANLVNAPRAVYTQNISTANQGLTPSTLIDPATGTVDPTKSSWSKSSWSQATGSLNAGWSRSSWSCSCSMSADGTIDPTRSSWSWSSWSTSWSK